MLLKIAILCKLFKKANTMQATDLLNPPYYLNKILDKLHHLFQMIKTGNGMDNARMVDKEERNPK